MNTAQKAGFI